MSWRGVTLQTRAASAAERRRRRMTSPSFAMSTWARISWASSSATSLPFRACFLAVAGGDECAGGSRACQEVEQVADTGPQQNRSNGEAWFDRDATFISADFRDIG